MRIESVKKHRKYAFQTIAAILLAATVAIFFVVTDDAYAKYGKYTSV